MVFLFKQNEMKSSVLIHEVKLITQVSIEFTKKKLLHLGPNQLNWKPSANAWNINEVLAHLNAYTKFYIEGITEKLNKTKYTTPIENFVSSPLGKAAWKSMKLGKMKNIKRKFRSPKEFNPSIFPSLINENTQLEYISLQEEYLKLLENAQNYNLRKVKLALSISKLSKLRLGDVLLFISYHNERHIQQILNILQNKKFPKKEHA